MIKRNFFKRVVPLHLFVCLLGASFALAEKPSKPLKIGLLLPLSGQYSAVGNDNLQGFEIARIEFDPSAKIQWIVADSKADPATSVSEFRKLVDIEGASAVFAFRGPVGMAVNPISKSSKIPVLGGVGNKDFPLQNEYAFQIWPPSDYEGRFLASELKRLGYRKIAICTVQDDWPVAVTAGLKEVSKQGELEIVFNQDILPSESDLKPAFAKMRASKPDAIFLNVGLNQVGPFLRQLRSLAIDIPVFANFWAGKKEVITEAGEAIEGLRYVEMSTDFFQLKDELIKKFKSSPSGATLSAYIGVAMVAHAAHNSGKYDATSLYGELQKISVIRTKNGDFKVTNRVVNFPMTLKVIRAGKVENWSE